jgi:hypothetical protein
VLFAVQRRGNVVFANANPITKLFRFIIVGFGGMVACLVGFLILVTVWNSVMGSGGKAATEAASPHEATTTTTTAQDEAIGSIVHGCQDGWRDKGYYSYEDCTRGRKFGQ